MSRRRNEILGRVRARSLRIRGTGATPSNANISGIYQGSITYDTASLIDAAGATSTNITVTGAALGDVVLVSLSVDLQGITVTGYVSAANTVNARIQNESTATVDLASATLKAVVLKTNTLSS